MQLLGSNSTVQVFLKDEVITMPGDKGYKLMDFLTTDNNASHVMITDKLGNTTVVNKYDIKKVSTVEKKSRYKTPDELGMPNL